MIEDRLYKFLGLYLKSPQFVKSVLGRVYRNIPLRLRYGKTYIHFKTLLSQSEFWSKEQIVEYQNKKFLTLINHCFENVPYYEKLFRLHNLTRNDFQSLEDIKKIPFLTKELILSNKDSMVGSNYSKSKLLYYSTGGTTGIPMSFFNEKGVSRSKEFAFMTSQWKRVGYQVNDRIVTLRGNVIPSAKNQVFWEYEPIKNRLILSTYHMNENSLTTYIEKIRQFKPQFIHTYPSAVTVLAKFMVAHHIPPFPTLKAVLCSSEAFYPGQRELLENAFQCRIFSWYGLGEMVALAGECEYSHKYHIFPEYGYVELIDANGKIIDSEGTLGEIVGTGFDRDIMPFIRYRTGDFAEYSDEKCSCGRNYRLLKRVEGRWLQEQIFTKKKNLISVTALNMHTPVFENVAQYQFEQSEIGRLILKLVPKKTFQNSDIADIKSTLTAKLDPSDIELEIKLVDTQQIESGRSGKFRFLIQNIK